MPQTATNPEQFQYVRLPDGSFGKFRANATDNEIRAKITAAFPDAYKAAATVDPQRPWQHKLEDVFERTALAAGVPKSPMDIPSMIGGMLLPQGDPKNPTFGESLPILGPVLTASQQVMNQPAKTPTEKVNRAIGSVPFVGPPFYAGSKSLEKGDFATAVGSLINIGAQFLGLKSPVQAALKGEIKPTVPYSPTASVKPGVAVTGTPKGFFSGKMPVIGGVALARRFGISPDLAEKIASRVEEIKTAREGMDAETTAAQRGMQKATQGVRIGVESDVAGIRQSGAASSGILDQMRIKTIQELEKQMGDLPGERLSIGRQLIADASKALHEEYERVKAPFEEIDKKIPGMVAEGPQVRQLINNIVKENGMNPEEIPATTFSPLGSTTVEKAILIGGKPWYPSQMREFMEPETLKTVMSGLKPEEIGGITFKDLTRTRESLYKAAGGSSKRSNRFALTKAAEALTEFQEKIAADRGLGKEYGIAKRDYLMFRRGIGSSSVEKWLSAEDIKAQNIERKLATLSTKANQRYLTEVLKSVGIDASNFFGLTEKQLRLSDQMKEVEKGAATETKSLSALEKSRVDELEAAGESHVSAIEKAAKERMTEARVRGEGKIKESQEFGNTVVPGKTTEELAGTGNVELNRMRLRALGNAVNQKGVPNQFALFQIVYGLARMATSPIWGAFHVAYGVSRESIPDVVRDPAFQNWVLKKTGIVPGSQVAAQIKQGLIDLANKSMPASRRAVLTEQQKEETVGAQP